MICPESLDAPRLMLGIASRLPNYQSPVVAVEFESFHHRKFRTPFNITTGQDTNGDRLFTERPSFASAGTNCNNPPANIVCTPFGNFNLRPAPEKR